MLAIITLDKDRYGDELEPITIISMAYRFPRDANTVESFWNILINARTGHKKVPPDRFNTDS